MNAKIKEQPQKKEFKPFTLIIEVETKEDLYQLYGRFNVPFLDAKKFMREDRKTDKYTTHHIFGLLQIKMNEL